MPSPLKCSEDAPTRPEPRADVDLSSKKSMRCSWLGAECVVETPAPATGAKASGSVHLYKKNIAVGVGVPIIFTFVITLPMNCVIYVLLTEEKTSR